MKFLGSLALTAATITTCTAIDLIAPRDIPRVVKHDIQRKHVEDPVARDRLRKRAKTVSASLANEETLYLMTVNIGTPSQQLNLHLDTGSSDLWVNTAKSTFCSKQSNECGVTGTYSANSSSSYKYINSLFNITYADGSGSSGDYVSDTVSFGGATLSAQEMGVGYISSSAEGIIGIGYQYDEAILAYNGARTYVNVPQNLVNSGYINTNAYSLWLNDLSASQGSILFGGVDTSKFSGTLQTVPIIKEYGLYSEFIIAMTAVGYNGNTGSIASNQAISVLLDSGSSLVYLPDSIAQSVYTLTGAQYDSSEQVAYISCSQSKNTTTIDFTFSGATIRVALSEMVVLYSNDGRNQICILGVGPTLGSQAVLGDTFLRSAYVVYDLNNNQISLAQTNFNGGSSNVLEIASSVPSATPVASAVTTVAAETTGGHINGGGGQLTIISTIGGSAAAPTAAAVYGAAVVGAVGAGILAVL